MTRGALQKAGRELGSGLVGVGPGCGISGMDGSARARLAEPRIPPPPFRDRGDGPDYNGQFTYRQDAVRKRPAEHAEFGGYGAAGEEQGRPPGPTIGPRRRSTSPRSWKPPPSSTPTGRSIRGGS